MIAILLALMALVPSTNNSRVLSCTGGGTPGGTGNINFPYLSPTDLVVVSSTAGALIYLTDYVLTATRTSTTATISLLNPAVKCPNGATLTVTRTVTPTQPYRVKSQPTYNASTAGMLEDAHDREVMISQQLTNLFNNNVLGQGSGGTGTSTTLTCTADQFVTSVGPSYSCATLAVNRDASLSGAGSIASPLAVNVQHDGSLTGAGTVGSTLKVNPANSNSFTVGQTFAASGNGLAAVNMTPTTSQPASPINGDYWLDPTDGLRVRYNGSWHLLSTTTSSTRRTATDANDYIVWTADESSLPLVNTGSAGSNGNITTVNAASSGAFGCLGTFSNSYCTNGTGKNGSSGASSGSLNPALPVSMSAWVLLWGGVGGEIMGKKFQPNGTYTGALLTMDIGLTGGLAPACDTTSGGSRTSCSGSAGSVTAGTWHHLGCTYDGSNMRVYLDGQLAVTCVRTGAIDYGTNGPWYIGANSDNSGGLNGFIDDVRVATVARPLSYFQNIWTTATGNGGN